MDYAIVTTPKGVFDFRVHGKGKATTIRASFTANGRTKPKVDETKEPAFPREALEQAEELLQGVDGYEEAFDVFKSGRAAAHQAATGKSNEEVVPIGNLQRTLEQQRLTTSEDNRRPNRDH